MRHKHADLIKEWVEDTSQIVQYFWNNQWSDWNWVSGPHFTENCEWRFKPEPKPDVVRYVNASETSVNLAANFEFSCKNLKLTFDGETGKLKSAEVINE